MGAIFLQTHPTLLEHTRAFCTAGGTMAQLWSDKRALIIWQRVWGINRYPPAFLSERNFLKANLQPGMTINALIPYIGDSKIGQDVVAMWKLNTYLGVFVT